jgi:Ca-activated chloride channel family protein
MLFGYPEFLWGFAAAPFILFLFLRISILRKKALERFGQIQIISNLIPASTFTFLPLRAFLFTLAYSFLVVALARPLFGKKEDRVERRGVDIMIALDISHSMFAEDIYPNRIQRAKYEISDLFSTLRGERVGLTIFAGQSFLQMPLTSDYSVAQMFVESIDPSWISHQGTDIAGAIKKSSQAFKMEDADKVILLFSDGEEHSGTALQAAEQAAQQNVTIYTIGMGSTQGTLIPVTDGAGNRMYKRDSDGTKVVTRLNADLLEKIAMKTGGAFFHAETNLDLGRIYADIQNMQKGVFEERNLDAYREHYQLFLLAGMICFFLYFLVPSALSKKQKWRGRLV